MFSPANLFMVTSRPGTIPLSSGYGPCTVKVDYREFKGIDAYNLSGALLCSE